MNAVAGQLGQRGIGAMQPVLDIAVAARTGAGQQDGHNRVDEHDDGSVGSDQLRVGSELLASERCAAAPVVVLHAREQFVDSFRRRAAGDAARGRRRCASKFTFERRHQAARLRCAFEQSRQARNSAGGIVHGPCAAERPRLGVERLPFERAPHVIPTPAKLADVGGGLGVGFRARQFQLLGQQAGHPEESGLQSDDPAVGQQARGGVSRDEAGKPAHGLLVLLEARRLHQADVEHALGIAGLGHVGEPRGLVEHALVAGVVEELSDPLGIDCLPAQKLLAPPRRAGAGVRILLAVERLGQLFGRAAHDAVERHDGDLAAILQRRRLAPGVVPHHDVEDDVVVGVVLVVAVLRPAGGIGVDLHVALERLAAAEPDGRVLEVRAGLEVPPAGREHGQLLAGLGPQGFVELLIEPQASDEAFSHSLPHNGGGRLAHE